MRSISHLSPLRPCLRTTRLGSRGFAQRAGVGRRVTARKPYSRHRSHCYYTVRIAVAVASSLIASGPRLTISV
ncbi:hypothetical protein K466DRAFT_591215 [Polyporus arcularius HHB13444]|uniref:Uncharacterized protein n=1 Tax=Polyporus arcularius HHB13444 TaxID=1314778 RepID=A0A5C3P6Q8_9APHY|nr:hypothetical protein K466DRAFT_591215 [Polyporus arcularius HHB13444]